MKCYSCDKSLEDGWLLILQTEPKTGPLRWLCIDHNKNTRALESLFNLVEKEVQVVGHSKGIH